MKPCALGILRTKKGLILVKRRDIPLWVLPGGGIDQGETPEQAIVREVLEETGLTVKIKRKVAEYTPINRLAQETHVFECTVISGTMKITEETNEILAFDEANLPGNFFIVHREWLQDAQKNYPHVLRKKITNVTYGRVFLYLIRHPCHIFRALLARCGCPINKGPNEP